ncbi:MAG: hypothetical protein Q9157_008717 [Trypethelium eluteriae]
MHHHLPLYAATLQQDRHTLMSDIGASLVEIRALATEEAINNAVGEKFQAKWRGEKQEQGNRSSKEGSCPFVDKLPVNLRNRIYEMALACKGPLRVIPRRRRFSSEFDWETESLMWYASHLHASKDAPKSMLRHRSIRLNAGIFCVNKLIHEEALKVFYRLNIIRCDDPELARLWLHPKLMTYLHRLEVSFSSLDQLGIFRRREDWQSIVNVHALFRLADDAPRLQHIIVRVDEILPIPVGINLKESELKQLAWTFSSFLEAEGLSDPGGAECFARGRWRITAYPRLEFRHFRLAEVAITQ